MNSRVLNYILAAVGLIIYGTMADDITVVEGATIFWLLVIAFHLHDISKNTE